MEFSLRTDVHTVSNHNDRVRITTLFATIYLMLHRYGNLVPRTKWGTIVTRMYAVSGISVYIRYFMNMEKVRISKT